jgi:hypothetical protein
MEAFSGDPFTTTTDQASLTADTNLAEFLVDVGLQKYADILDKEGFTDVSTVDDEALQKVGMTRLEMKKFRSKVEMLRTARSATCSAEVEVSVSRPIDSGGASVSELKKYLAQYQRQQVKRHA